MEASNLLERLVSIPSVSGDEGKIACFLARLLKDGGVELELGEVSPGRPNLLARIPGEGSPLLYMGHMDTVPPGDGWKGDPFTPVWHGSRLTALGSCDMKGGLAAMVLALQALAKRAKRRETWGLFTVGEEEDLQGAFWALNKWLRGRSFRLLVVPEPTGLRMGVAEKGVLWLRFILTGKGGHASMGREPRALEGACRLALEVVREVREKAPGHPLLGFPTAEVTQVHGGWKTNVIPPRAILEVDIRLVPGMEPDSLLGRLKDLVHGTRVKAEMEVINNRPPVESRRDPVLGEFARVAERVMGREVERVGLPYYSDVSALVPEIDMPFVLFGPGDPALAHTPGEWVDIEEVKTVARVLEELALL